MKKNQQPKVKATNPDPQHLAAEILGKLHAKNERVKMLKDEIDELKKQLTNMFVSGTIGPEVSYQGIRCKLVETNNWKLSDEAKAIMLKTKEWLIEDGQAKNKTTQTWRITSDF